MRVVARTSGLRVLAARIALLGAMLGFAYGCVSEAQRTAPEKVMHEYPVSEVGREDFVSGRSREVIENAEPKSQGGEILQAQVLYNQTVSNTVASLGIPDAVEETIETTNPGVLPAKTTEFFLFYRHPARTIIIDNSGIDFWSNQATGAMIGDLPVVPGYARVFGFNEAITGAWPVTISPSDASYFSLPPVPQQPPPEISDGSDYAPVAQQIVSGVTTVSQGSDYGRAQRAFVRLAEVASTKGLNWQLYVYESEYDEGYGVPDGSIFVSKSLIEHLDSDDELTAVLAHLMAHERYEHSRNAITRANQSALEAGAASPFVGFASLLVPPMAPYALVLGGVAVATPFMSYPTKLGFFGYEDSEELEADALAAQYLVQLHIAPGTVVNAVHDAIRHAPPPGDFELRWFGHLHKVESTGPEFAKLLDAGSISSALDREPSASWKKVEHAVVPQCDHAAMQSSARRGDVQFATGDPAGALGYYQQALSACPSNAQVQFYVARAYEAQGDRDMAVDYYERAIRFASSDDQAIAEAARKAVARLSAR